MSSAAWYEVQSQETEEDEQLEQQATSIDGSQKHQE